MFTQFIIFVVLAGIVTGCSTMPLPRLPAQIAEDIDIDVTEPAKKAHFDYEMVVRRALAGDREALLTLIEFSPQLSSSAAGAEEHGDVLAQLYEHLDPVVFRKVFARASPQAKNASLGLIRTMSYHPETIRLP